jgi:hypothetical protein
MKRILRPAVVACLSLGVLVADGDPLFSQSTPERVWLAGRYDSASVVVYFEAVKFKGTFPADAASMVVPIADAFFTPKALSADFLAGLPKERGAERFAVGDLYDLLLDGGRVATITLTTLIGFESDEFVGNDSYIGALGIVAPEDLPFFTKDYYVVQHRQAARRAGPTRPTRQPAIFASLGNEPASLDLQIRVTSLLRERLATGAPTAVRIEMEQTPPFSQRAQPFTLADSSLRYHVWAEWRLRAECFAISAWLGTAPTLHILAAEEPTCELNGLDPVEPRLRNVVDLGGGRLALIVSFEGGDGRSLELLEYRDGVGLADMGKLQSISAGE